MIKRLMLPIGLLMTLVVPLLACSLTAAERSTPPTLQPTATIPAPDSSIQMPLVYFYFVPLASGTYPAGSVTILADQLVLGPTRADPIRTDDPALNLRGGLQAALEDARNVWTGELTIGGVSFENGHVIVDLAGQIGGVGDVVLIAARMQIILTVFTESAVQSAVIILNGENIANLGISHPSEAKPADYAYTRSEIEAFITANPYPA